jgi:integrase
MVTGQRKGQFASLKEEWVDWQGKRFIWPASAMKTNKIHVLPFNALAEFVLRGVMPVGGYYFSPASALGQPFTAWSKSKTKLDSLVDLDAFTIHDLRRTWSTNAARLDIPPHITERVLSHVAPEGKIAGIYNRHRYESEMRDAMERMSTFVMGLMSA